MLLGFFEPAFVWPATRKIARRQKALLSLDASVTKCAEMLYGGSEDFWYWQYLWLALFGHCTIAIQGHNTLSRL